MIIIWKLIWNMPNEQLRRIIHVLRRSGVTFINAFWYDRYLEHGEDGLVDRASHPGRVWNKIPDTIRSELIEMALDIPELSPRELAVRFTDTKGYFVSESSVYRLL